MPDDQPVRGGRLVEQGGSKGCRRGPDELAGNGEHAWVDGEIANHWDVEEMPGAGLGPQRHIGGQRLNNPTHLSSDEDAFDDGVALIELDHSEDIRRCLTCNGWPRWPHDDRGGAAGMDMAAAVQKTTTGRSAIAAQLTISRNWSGGSAPAAGRCRRRVAARHRPPHKHLKSKP